MNRVTCLFYFSWLVNSVWQKIQLVVERPGPPGQSRGREQKEPTDPKADSALALIYQPLRADQFRNKKAIANRRAVWWCPNLGNDIVDKSKSADCVGIGVTGPILVAIFSCLVLVGHLEQKETI